MKRKDTELTSLSKLSINITENQGLTVTSSHVGRIRLDSRIQDGSGDVAIKLLYGDTRCSKAFDVIRILISSILLIISISGSIYAILHHHTLMGNSIPPWSNFVLLLLSLFYLGCLEGLQIAVVELAHNNPKIYEKQYPRAAGLLALENKGRNVERFLVGRQVMVVFIVFLLARLTSYEEFYVNLPDYMLETVFKYGFMGTLIVVNIAQLTPQVLASAYPIQFLNLPIMKVVFYSCLLVEISGVAHAVYLLCYFCKNYLCKCLCNSNSINTEISNGQHNNKIKDQFGYQSLGKMASIANETERKLTSNIRLKNIGKAINININNFTLPSRIGNILPNIYSSPNIKPVNTSKFGGYPSPTECYQMFKDLGLKPPKFLENPQNSEHIPPHIIALELLNMCCNDSI